MISLKNNNILNAKTIVFTSFAVIYMLISFVNHYMFRTNAHDYGIFNQALYDYAHFRFNNNSVIEPGFGNLLGDHFELLLMLISPLYYIFGGYTLLIVQIIAILLGGQGVYKYIQWISSNNKLALSASIHFFLFFGIFSALAFDFHNNVLGAMAVPWMFYYFKKENLKAFIIVTLIFLLSKENMGLWGFFIMSGIIVMYRKEKKKMIIASITAILSLIYFFVIVHYVIPAFGKPGAGYLHFRYSALGSNMGEAIATLFSKPLYAIGILFTNHEHLPKADWVKAELHLSLLFSGVLLLFLRPYYIWMILPIYGQKLFCDLDTYWGLGAHYNVEFIPIITIGAFSIISSFEASKTRRILAYSLLALTFAVTFRSFDNTFTWFSRQKQRVYQSPHYTREFSVSEAYKALKLIPSDAPVCAQDELLPHLCFREKAYLFPYIEDAEYIVVTMKGTYYPFETLEAFEKKVEELKGSTEWEVIYNENEMLIFKRTS